MNRKRYIEILFECSKYISTININDMILSINLDVDDITFLDNINEFIHNLKQNEKIDDLNFKKVMLVLAEYYKKDTDYVENRIDWINELRNDEKSLSLKEHQKTLMESFDILNTILNFNDIDYFHSSGFLCYLLTNNFLERYHHDIDLYVNVDDFQKIINVFNSDLFKVIHTCEKSSNGSNRHGYKIETSLNNIPIWLSFYKRLHNGTIYIQEYFQEENGNYFTMENYNSSICCDLSLIKTEYNGVKFTSLSLEALYLSKNGIRKKDIYDCKIMHKFVNLNKLDLLRNEIDNSWQKINGIPLVIENAITSEYKEVENNGLKFTKKRI